MVPTIRVPHSPQDLKAAVVVLVALIVFSANSRPASAAASCSQPSRLSQYLRGGSVFLTSPPAPVAFLELKPSPWRPLKLSGSSTTRSGKGEPNVTFRTKRKTQHRHRNHRSEDVVVVPGEELPASVDATTEPTPPLRQPHRCCGRRSLLSGITSTAPPSLMMIITPQFAFAAGGAPEAIRRGAANIPGYGQPDVFYPGYFAGSWRCTRTIAASPPSSAADGKSGAVTLVYEVRFLETADGRTIADRGYNRASYIRAASEAGLNPLGTDSASGGGGGDAASPIPPLRTVDWDASNPNILTVTFANGYVQEVRVTKRAFEASSSGDAGTDQGGGGGSGDGMSTFFSSEYRRVTDIDGERGIPSLSGSRVLTKWKRDLDKNNVIEGIELVYYDGVLGDPMGGGFVGGGGSKSVTKSRLLLERS